MAAPPDRSQLQEAITRRINAPYFGDNVRSWETAIVWFGLVTPTENAADARVGYNDEHIYFKVSIFDRRLWYDTSPSPEDLTAWDAVSLYLDTSGSAGSVPETTSYRFDAQLVHWGARDDYQAAYRGDGTAWVMSSLSFTTVSGWDGTGPNTQADDRAWKAYYFIPFESLGLSGPPAKDTIWRMAVVVHDRDDEAGSAIPDQTWPETLEPEQPATWGELAFGMPEFIPPSATPEGTLVVRHGLKGATVVDADVGGSTNCGQPAWPEYFPTWGSLNYAGQTVVNIQNLGDVGDWTCFSRYYVTFPLEALPPGKAILSATLTLVQFGNAGEGEDPGPQPSLIQVHTVAEDWDEATLTWNNSPLAVENVAAAWADVFPELPGEPREWDVSRVVAEAYASGEPLRLALYESDKEYHSGKYFWSSDVDEWSAEMRPTLTITWGRPAAGLTKSVNPTSGYQGDLLVYSLGLQGSGNPLALTDVLPSGVSDPAHLDWSGTDVAPVYDAGQHRLTWSDAPALGQQVYLTYTVELVTDQRQALVNVAELQESGGGSSRATATVIANPRLLHLPLVLRDN
jgi:hypothetical protein